MGIITQNGQIVTVNGSILTYEGDGGGGLEYETGTWTPTTDIAEQTISFLNQHTKRPFMITVYDVTGTTAADNSNVMLNVVSFYDLFGSGSVYPYGSYHVMGRMESIYSYNGGAVTTSVVTITGVAGSSEINVGYWMTAAQFRLYTRSTSRFWRSGRTYKWIAVWAPTT